jgi:ferrochelatase
VNDKAFEALMKMRRQPALRTAPAWHDDPVYIQALVESLKKHLTEQAFEPEVILASFHGLPRSYLDKGDPYHCHCQKTGRLMREMLGLSADRFIVTFQSRFGRAEWLQPYTDMTVKRLAEEGVKRLAVVTPGFVADCVETLEEIAGENAEIFHEHGGEKFFAVPCLNDSSEGMQVIERIVLRELQGWL